VAVGDELPVVADDEVLVAKPRALHVDAAALQMEQVVEAGWCPVAANRLEHERFDAVVAKCLVAAGMLAQVLDTSHLEPHEVGGVVRDPLCVGIGEPHPDRRGEREAGHLRESRRA
jgi:hypothetical protein